MAVKKKLKAPVPEKTSGPIAVEQPAERSPHADTKFITGKLGQDLADANDAAIAALKAAGIKPVKKPISTDPFTTDPNRRKFLAGFVTNETHRRIVMPDESFKSSFGSNAERKQPMSEETKGYLREKKAAKAMLHPKKPAGGTSIQDICTELKIHPRDARKALRKAKIEKPDCGWVWKTKEEAMEVATKAGLIGGGKKEPAVKATVKDVSKKKPAVPVTPAAPKKVQTKEELAAIAKKNAEEAKARDAAEKERKTNYGEQLIASKSKKATMKKKK